MSHDLPLRDAQGQIILHEMPPAGAGERRTGTMTLTPCHLDC